MHSFRSIFITREEVTQVAKLIPKRRQTAVEGIVAMKMVRKLCKIVVKKLPKFFTILKSFLSLV